MPFSIRLPREVPGSNYPIWEDVLLTEAEEREVESAAKIRSIALLNECLTDAEAIMRERNMKPFQTDLVQLASELFGKRSSHEVFWKEAKSKEKFREMWKSL